MRPEMVDPRKYIIAWFKANKLEIKANSFISGPSHLVAIDSIWLDYKETLNAENVVLVKNGQSKSKGIGVREMTHALADFLACEPERVKQQVIDSLVYTGDNTGPLSNWITAVMGQVTPFNLAIMQHFLWQIKRKMYAKKVVYHLCPMLFGAQNGGKSTAVSKLLGPVNDLAINLPPNEVTDPRTAKTLSDRFVCVFDEMSGMGRVDMEAFKRVITDEYVSYRPMRTNDSRRVKQNTTFIGLSNKSLSENINDSTGMRRFVEIHCLDKINWDLINNTDALAIWKSINESLDQGYVLPVLPELQLHQADLLTLDEVPHFVQDNNLSYSKGDETKEMTIEKIHEQYMIWRESNGYAKRPPVAINFFSGKLRTACLQSFKRSIDGKIKTIYVINKSAFVTKPIHAVIAEFNHGN